MKVIATAFLAMFLVGCAAMPTTEIVSEVQDGVVLIENDIGNGQGGIGTGFILNDNQIITNLHVVDKPGTITVYSDDSRRKYKATVAFKDEVADIAVLRLYDWELFEANETPVNLSLGKSEHLQPGQRLVVLGHPWGLTWTVSEGILSSKDRRMGQNPKYLFQIDAKLYEGNSGGPIFNGKGQVVCVSNMMLVREGGSYGFCIPSDLVKKVIYDFNTFGEVRWRVLNVAAGLTDDGSSVIFTSVEPGGAAGMAGIKDGDKVLEIYTPNSHPEGVRIVDPNTLITELAQLRGDDELVKLLIERNGEKIMVDVKTNYKLSKEYTPDKGK